MNKNSSSRNRFIHLYNPEKEGLGSYDKNYINAYKKDTKARKNIENIYDERFAAWYHP